MADIRRILNAFYGSEWAILPEKLEEIESLLLLKSSGSALREELRVRYAAMSPPSDMSRGQISVLNMFGTISQRMNGLSEFSGGTSTEMFSKAFGDAVDNPNISAILINADTPGGSVPGVPELSDQIYNARGSKPIKTIVNPMMASGGIWIGTAADEVIAIPSASAIGSIGVLSMHTDHSEADAKAGRKTTIIKSVEYKAEGNPYEPLSAESIAHHTERVNQIHAEFVDAVARNRGVSVAKVESDFGRGRTFRAVDAQKAGLIDRVATLEQILTELGAGASSSSRVSVTVPASFETTKGNDMNAKIKLQLVKAGLCKATSTDEEAQAALNLHCEVNGVVATHEAAVLASFGAAAPVETTSTPENDTAQVTLPVTGKGSPCMEVADLISAVKISGISPQRQLELISELTPTLPTAKLPTILDAINKASREGQETAGHDGGDVSVTASEIDKFRIEARDAIIMNGMPDLARGGKTQLFDYTTGEYADWSPRRVNVSYDGMKLAESCLVRAGVPYQQVQNMAPMNVARMVLGGDPRQMGLGNIRIDGGGAFNVTGMFSNILLDAAQVALRRSYDDTKRITYDRWMRQASSALDFKPHHSVLAGELGDPKAIPEDGEFEEVTLSDTKEQYAVGLWGSMFSVSWQTLVNDRLRSFNEIPVKLGRSMRRKENRLGYQVVKDNAALQSDSVALFSAATHNNRQTGANSTVAALKAKWAAMKVDMRNQTGLDADSGTLGYTPRFIIAPDELEDLIWTTLNSRSVDTTNPAIRNSHEGMYEPVFESEMSAAAGGSDTRYILAADPMDVDTIEYRRLAGLESPVIEQHEDFKTLTISRRMYSAIGFKAIDFRGLQDDTGV